MQLSERALVPRQRVLDIDHLADRGRRDRLHAPVPDGRGGRRVLEQVAQGGNGALRPGEAFFQAAEVRGDQVVARPEIRRGQHGLDLVQRHVEAAEAADDLGGRDLIRRIAAVTGLLIHIGGLEQADPVIVTQRLDAQMSRASEVTDREG